MSEAVDTNIELVRRTYELWNMGGVEAVEQVWAPDIVFYDLPEVPDTGIFRGAQQVAARMRAITEPIGHFQVEVRSVEGCRDYTLAALVLSATGASSGVPLTAPQFHVTRWANGRTRELRVYLDADQARREYEHLSSESA